MMYKIDGTSAWIDLNSIDYINVLPMRVYRPKYNKPFSSKMYYGDEKRIDWPKLFIYFKERSKPFIINCREFDGYNLLLETANDIIEAKGKLNDHKDNCENCTCKS